MVPKDSDINKVEKQMKYGYARVSTNAQDLTVQNEELKIVIFLSEERKWLY